MEFIVGPEKLSCLPLVMANGIDIEYRCFRANIGLQMAFILISL